MGESQNQYLVLGLGKFGSSVAKTLVKANLDVLAVERDPSIVEHESQFLPNVVQADITDENVLKSLDAGNFDIAVIATGEDVEASIMCTLILKELGVKYIFAKARDKRHAMLLEKIGADKVISPEEEMGMRVARSLMNKNILDIVEISEDYSITEVKVPEKWANKKLMQLDLRNKYEMNVLQVKSEGVVTTSPSADYELKVGDVLIVLINNSSIKEPQ